MITKSRILEPNYTVENPNRLPCACHLPLYTSRFRFLQTGMVRILSCSRVTLFLYVLLLCAILILIGSLPLWALEGSNFQAELSSELKYTHLKEGIPYMDSDLTSTTTFKIGASGLFALPRQNWQYALKIKTWAHDTQGFTSDIALEELILSALIKKDAQFSLLEIGKKDWEWGKCFSRIPTYPLPAGNFWGAQWTIPSNDRHLILGAATLKGGLIEFGNNYDQRAHGTEHGFTGWIRIGGFLTISDYEIVFSYQNNDPDHPDTRARDVVYNLGADFSRDFLNGLAMHGSINLEYPPEEKGNPTQAHTTHVDYVFGGEYIHGDKTIVCEVFSQSINDRAGLVWAINNYSSLFAKCLWELESVWNLSDNGRFYGLLLEYTAFDRLTPSLELLMYEGPEDSRIGLSPFDMMLIMKITAVF